MKLVCCALCVFSLILIESYDCSVVSFFPHQCVIYFSLSSIQWFGKEIIRQLRLRKKDGQPFVLQESARRMHDPSVDTALTSTVAQLAWEKDIDLTKGVQGVSPSSPLPSPIHELQGPQFPVEAAPPRPVANGNAVRAPASVEITNLVEERLPPDIRMRPVLQAADPPVQRPKNVADASTPALKRKKNLVYNRVSPLSLGPGVPGEPTVGDAFSDISEAPVQRGKDKFQYPSSTSYKASTPGADSGREGSPTRNVVISDEPNNRIVQSEFSFSASSDTGTEAQPLTKPRRRTAAGKQLERAESARELKGSQDLVGVVGTLVTSPRRSFSTAPNTSRDVEVAEPASGATHETTLAGSGGATCWTEDSSEVTLAKPKSKKKSKKQRSRSKPRKSGNNSGDSGSSLLRLDKGSDERSSNV